MKVWYKNRDIWFQIVTGMLIPVGGLILAWWLVKIEINANTESLKNEIRTTFRYENDFARKQALQSYLIEMSSLTKKLLQKDKNSELGDQIAAASLTRDIFILLNSTRDIEKELGIKNKNLIKEKKRVLFFLKNAMLINSIDENKTEVILDISGADLRYSDLKNMELKNTYLKKSLFDQSDLSETFLNDSELQGSKFSASILEGTNFSGASLEGAKFYNVKLKKSDFSNAILLRTEFIKSDLSESNLTNSQINSAKFIEVDLGDTQGLDFDDLMNASLICKVDNFPNSISPSEKEQIDLKYSKKLIEEEKLNPYKEVCSVDKPKKD